MEKLNSLLETESSKSLFLDYYELTSGKANLDHSRNETITETFFFRKIPEHMGKYMVTAGLEQVIDFIKSYRLSDEDAEWLKESSNGALDDKFIDYLKNFKFEGSVYAVPEGTVVFPNEPIISITGKSIDVQLFETYLLSVMNYETMVATKASRIDYASKGRQFLDFGARRAHGRDAAILSSRASYIGGASGTALLSAARKLNIPYSGTMPHKFVQERDSELEAFLEYTDSFPDNSVLLIDTYDTIRGAERACEAGRLLRKRGYDLKGVRIDSGNLLDLSRKVRRILDSNGFYDTKITVSSDLDEYAIDYLVSNGAPVDSFGVGTRLDTAANYNSTTGEGGVSALGGVFKLVEVEENDEMTPRMKISSDGGKKTLPYQKQIYRFIENGKIIGDTVDRMREYDSAAGLLKPVILDGKIVYSFPTLKEIRSYAKSQVESLDERYKRIEKPETFPVTIGNGILEGEEKFLQQIAAI